MCQRPSRPGACCLACRDGSLVRVTVRSVVRPSTGQPRRGSGRADHFIPRIRCGIDAVENLVLADRRCNTDKRDLLPGPAHVTAWARRNHCHSTALAGVATAARWDTDLAATVAVARSIYNHLPGTGAPLWLGFKKAGTADPATALAAMT